jgi:hypothetical protein
LCAIFKKPSINMKDWEKYEEQIFEKLNELFPSSSIEKNQKIIGKFSERSRQIDILVKSESIGREIIIVIDCKKFSKKIDIKTVESFIGFSEDVGAHIGIMITNIGYSKSAEKRAKNHHKDIQLDIVEFQDFEDYEFAYDTCIFCRDEDDYPIGLIRLSEPLPLVTDGVVTLINTGNCSYCGESYIRCQGCGDLIHVGNDMDEYECQCGNTFEVESEYIGSGMTEEHIYIRDKNYVRPEFIDPNQTNLFE